MIRAISSLSRLPTEFRLAGKRVHIGYSSQAPAPLTKLAVVLRRSSLQSGKRRLSSSYWQTSRRGCYRLYWSDAGTFDLDAKRGLVECFPLPQASRAAIEEVLRGPVCSFFLLEQGFEPLHAGAVVLDGRAVAFAGAPGAGKSSLAAWLTKNGAGFLCDDILPVRRRGQRLLGYPCLNNLRLESRAMNALGFEAQASRRSAQRPSSGKLTLGLRPATKPAVLSRIYLLDRKRRGDPGSIRVKILPPRQAFRALLTHTRNDSLRTASRLRRQLRMFARLARTIPVSRLTYPGGFARLRDVEHCIREDLAS